MVKSKQAVKDSELIAILQGESTGRAKEGAFNQLYSNHERQLLMFFKQRIHNEEDAEDLRSTTFIKVHSSIDSFKPDEVVFSTWLYKIATNTLIDFTRKKELDVISIDALSTKLDDTENGFGEFQIKCDTQNPEQVMISEQETDKIMKLVDSIENEVVRTLFKKRLLEGLSFEETAVQMGLKNSSTLRITIKRMREKFAKTLER
jgi:RNA polymerase sigma factor (sigma-70 family)